MIHELAQALAGLIGLDPRTWTVWLAIALCDVCPVFFRPNGAQGDSPGQRPGKKDEKRASPCMFL